jgi:hypothetical protein
VSPDDYVFPGCHDCNNGSSDRDAIFAYLAWTGTLSEQVRQHRDQWGPIASAFAERHPEQARAMWLPRGVKQRAMRAVGLRPGVGQSWAEQPLVAVPPEAQRALDDLSRKIILALHYRHTGLIVPNSASLFSQWITNFTAMGVEFGPFIAQLDSFVAPAKGRRSLADQFMYRYKTFEGGRCGWYAAILRDSFIVIGEVSFDGAVNEKDSADEERQS